MRFNVTEIAPEGRNKYGNYYSKGNTTRNVVSVSYGGNATTNNIAQPETQIAPEVAEQWYVQIKETNVDFTTDELANVTTKSVGFNVMRGTEYVPIYLMDISAVTYNTATTQYNIPANNGVVCNPTGPLDQGSGLTLSFSNNGTSAATINLQTTSALGNWTGGTLTIPVTMYVGKGTQPTGDSTSVWYGANTMKDEDGNIVVTNECQTTWIKLDWTITQSVENTYVLDLTNEMAGVNCDADGNIVSGAILPECTAKYYYGTDLVTGATYTLYTAPNYNVQGLTGSTTSTGYVLNFQNNFSFDGTTLAIQITASYMGHSMTKTMTVMKNIPGQNGQPGDNAVTRWLMISPNAAVVDNEEYEVNPNTITAQVWKQEGGNPMVQDSSTTIWYKYVSLSHPESWASGSTAMTITLDYDEISHEDYVELQFALMTTAGTPYEQESVPLVSNGPRGQQGQPGRTGAAIRGPIDWYSGITANRRFCNGVGPLSGDTLWIDILLKDGVYYKCSTSYNHQTGQTWSQVSSNWTTADTAYDFVATQVLLAENGKINFMTGNEIYLMNSGNTITGGARAATSGNPIVFWAGSEDPGSASTFTVNYDGEITATKGTFGCLTIDTDGPEDTLEGDYEVSNHTTQDIQVGPRKIILKYDESNTAVTYPVNQALWMGPQDDNTHTMNFSDGTSHDATAMVDAYTANPFLNTPTPTTTIKTNGLIEAEGGFAKKGVGPYGYYDNRSGIGGAGINTVYTPFLTVPNLILCPRTTGTYSDVLSSTAFTQNSNGNWFFCGADTYIHWQNMNDGQPYYPYVNYIVGTGSSSLVSNTTKSYRNMPDSLAMTFVFATAQSPTSSNQCYSWKWTGVAHNTCTTPPYAGMAFVEIDVQ